MDLKSYERTRLATQGSRRPPQDPVQVRAVFADESIGGDVGPGAIELTIEATDGQMELAPWFDDIWWTEVIRRWADRSVAVHFAPTPGALLHPVVLFHVDMLRRVTPNWRISGHAYIDDAIDGGFASAVAGSPYHDVRIADHPRPGAVSGDRRACQPKLEEVFAQIRREQVRLGVNAPALVRVPSVAPTGKPETSRAKNAQSRLPDPVSTVNKPS